MQLEQKMSCPDKGILIKQKAKGNKVAFPSKNVSENSIVYLKYENLEDMLKVILFSAQSMLGVVPMLYHINQGGKSVMFLQTGAIGGVTIHYVVEKAAPNKKFIQLKRLTGDYSLVDSIGSDSQSLYVPILSLEKATLSFPG